MMCPCGLIDASLHKAMQSNPDLLKNAFIRCGSWPADLQVVLAAAAEYCPAAPAPAAPPPEADAQLYQAAMVTMQPIHPPAQQVVLRAKRKVTKGAVTPGTFINNPEHRSILQTQEEAKEKEQTQRRAGGWLGRERRHSKQRCSMPRKRPKTVQT